MDQHGLPMRLLWSRRIIASKLYFSSHNSSIFLRQSAGIGTLDIFHRQNKEPHPFHVQPNWMPPVQPSTVLVSYLENVKAQLAEITETKPKKEVKTTLLYTSKTVGKGTATTIMNKTEKIEEAKVQPDNRVHYKPLRAPIVNMKTRRQTH